MILSYRDIIISSFDHIDIRKRIYITIACQKKNTEQKIEFYNKEMMNKVSFAKDITDNEIRKENFIESFLSSVRQKMQSRRK